jgi:putative aldouronate transport system substrate-binding protein
MVQKRFLALVLSIIMLLSITTAFAEATDTATAPSLADKVNGTKIQKLTEEPVTLTAWIRIDNNGATNLINSLSEMDLLKTMAEKTGITLEVIAAPIGQEQASFSLMLASGKLPDLIFNFPDFYTKGGDAAIEEGIIVDLNDLVKEYAPNYEKVRNYSENRQRSTMTDSGQQPFLCSFNYLDQPIMTAGGPVIRKDLLNKLEMDTLETYDDWYNFLSACTNELGLKRALGMNFDGMFKFDAFICGFGFALSDNQPFYQIDNKIQYAPLTDNYKEYIETMAKWYSEGLIDQDFTSTITFDDGIGMMTSGQAAATCDHAALINHVNTLGQAVDPDFEFAAVPNPVKNAGDTIDLYTFSSAFAIPLCAISTSCENPGLALAFVDQFYTDEGFLLCNYGTEGKTYNWVDGKPVYTDLVTNNDKGTIRDVLSAYAAPTVWLYESVIDRTDNAASTANNMIWESNLNKSTQMPSGISLTADENNQYTTLFPEIKSYVDEMRIKYIMGLESMDTYDDYLETLHSLGIDEVIALYQTALDRYLSR